jgi:hypothetical protein
MKSISLPFESASATGFWIQRIVPTMKHGARSRSRSAAVTIGRARTRQTASKPSTLKPFLTKKGHNATDAEKMNQAWLKSLLLQIALWSVPYVKEGDW